MLRGLHFTLTLLIAAAAVLAPVAPATAGEVEAYAVKAALVYNFALFTDWPKDSFADEDAPLRICIFGGDDLRDAFAGIDKRQIDTRRIEVVYTDDVRQLDGCHLVFVPDTERSRWPQLRAAIDGRPVLTVGEMNGFLETGGMMNLVLEDNRVVFQVNLSEVKRAELAISARILKLAARIIEPAVADTP